MFHRIFGNERWWDRISLQYLLRREVVAGLHLGLGMILDLLLCVPFISAWHTKWEV
jgi:hypothetical protein